MGDNNLYSGANYGTDSSYGKDSFDFQYKFPASQFGVTTDPRNANQLVELSKKLNTGAGTVEISGVSTQMFESLPRQHLDEINRLRKLTGVDLTFHGPLIEPTGINPEARRWEPAQREQAERQIWSAVERSHQMNPKGNMVVTLHTSNGLPEQRGKIKTADGQEVDSSLAVIDERTGSFGAIPKPRKDFLLNKEQTVDDELKRMNEENWSKSLSQITVETQRSSQVLSEMSAASKEDGMLKESFDLYKLSTKNPKEYDQKMEDIKRIDSDMARGIENNMSQIGYADAYMRDAYTGFQEMFNQAYGASTKEEQVKLDKLAKEIAPKIEAYKKGSSEVQDVGEIINKGIRVLNGIKPQMLKPMREFAIDKASETFSNVALKAYDEFKDTAPILSLENPPAGMGLSRGEEIRDLVKATREKFIKKAQSEFGLSESDAKKQAEKLIGVTWDVGHINMVRKYGYDDKDIIKETEKVAPFVKHIHLSDNFGMEHTELPMGMGNVPTKEHMDLIAKYNKQAKKIIETGGPWYQFFQTSPLQKTLEAFGSPIYGMQMAPYWNQTSTMNNGYFAGYGAMLPDQHFSMYGAGFSNLPTELGGQIGGGRSRLSGNPME